MHLLILHLSLDEEMTQQLGTLATLLEDLGSIQLTTVYNSNPRRYPVSSGLCVYQTHGTHPCRQNNTLKKTASLSLYCGCRSLWYPYSGDKHTTNKFCALYLLGVAQVLVLIRIRGELLAFGYLLPSTISVLEIELGLFGFESSTFAHWAPCCQPQISKISK